MSTTEELITILSKQFPGWNRDGERGIIYYLNAVQKILCTVQSDQLMIIDESTGKLPLIVTTKGAYSYDLPSNVNFISKVLIEANESNFLANNYSRQDYGQAIDQQPSHYIDISGVKYLDFVKVRSAPHSDLTVAKVIFTCDPGTTTETYRYLGYKLPAELVSDSIPLTILSPYDVLYLLPATEIMISGVENHDIVSAYKAISEEFVPKMQKAFNTGAFGVNYETEDRGF